MDLMAINNLLVRSELWIESGLEVITIRDIGSSAMGSRCFPHWVLLDILTLVW